MGNQRMVSRSPTTPRIQKPRAQGGRASVQTVSVEGRELRLSNLEKVMYPSTGFTKGQVIDYYARMAPAILPYLTGRPLTLKRYPDGVDGEAFYEKMCPLHRPDWVHTATVAGSGKRGYVEFCLIEDLPSLVWVANLASLELHTLLWSVAHPDRPGCMVFDLDPGPGADIIDCARVAMRFQTLLADLKLKCFAKSSGGKGLHVYVPLNTPVTFSRTKAMSRSMAELIERDDPAHVTSNMRKELRTGKVFVDWSQNDVHKTTVSVYSLRARETPTVSMPLDWDEVKAATRRNNAKGLSVDSDAALARVKSEGDLFAPVLALRQKLPAG